VRAETGPWDAVDFNQGVRRGDSGVWRADLRGAPAGRRIWQTDPRANSMVLFDAAKWKRGVIVGRVMMLPEGELPVALAGPGEATAVAWRTEKEPRLPRVADTLDGAYLAFHWSAPRTKGRTGAMMSHLMVNEHPRGTWHRFAVYFDTEVAPETVVAITSAWPEDHAVNPTARWLRSRNDLFKSSIGKEVGFGLCAKDVPALWQGVKVVPLGPDMPPPPPGVAGQ